MMMMMNRMIVVAACASMTPAVSITHNTPKAARKSAPGAAKGLGRRRSTASQEMAATIKSNFNQFHYNRNKCDFQMTKDLSPTNSDTMSCSSVASGSSADLMSTSSVASETKSLRGTSSMADLFSRPKRTSRKKSCPDMEFTVSSPLRKASLNTQTVVDENGNSSLHKAAAEGDRNVVRMLLATSHADINTQNNAGNTPLHVALESGNDDIALLLSTYRYHTAEKLNVNIQNFEGNTPLHLCSLTKNFKVAKILCEPHHHTDGDFAEPINFDILNNESHTACNIACMEQFKPISDLLVSQNAGAFL